MLQRDPARDATAPPGASAPAPTSAAAQSAAGPDPELIAARAILNQAPRPDDVLRRNVSRALLDLPLFGLIEQRDRATLRLETLAGQLEEARRQSRGPGLEHGVPLTPAQMQDVTREMAGLRGEITRLRAEIGRQCTRLGTTESEARAYITQTFPDEFERRAVQIALTELAHNRAMAEAERSRLLLGGRDIAALRSLSRELHTERERIQELRRSGRRATYDLPSGGIGPANSAASSFAQDAEDQADEREAQLTARERAAVLQFPVLSKVSVETVATTPADSLPQLLGGRLHEVLAAIEQTEHAIADPERRGLIYSLPQVVELTLQDLGVESEATLQRVVEERRRERAADAAAIRTAQAAFAVTSAVITAAATMVGGPAAGAATGATATAIGAAIGAGVLAQSVERFLTNAAAVDATMDPRLRAFTAEHPDVAEVLMDMAGLAIDAGTMLGALRALETPVRFLRQEGRIAQFATAARAAAPAGVADRVIAGAIRRSMTTARLLRRIDAILDNTRFADADLYELRMLINDVIGAQPTLRSLTNTIHLEQQPAAGLLLEWLQTENRIRPLTVEALLHEWPTMPVAELKDILNPVRADAWFFDETELIFAREGDVGDLAWRIIHETTHAGQRLARTRAGVVYAGFQREMQAYGMAKEFAERVGDLVGGIENLPPGLHYWATRSWEELAQIALATNPLTHAIPPGFNPGQDGPALVRAFFSDIERVGLHRTRQGVRLR